MSLILESNAIGLRFALVWAHNRHETLLCYADLAEESLRIPTLSGRSRYQANRYPAACACVAANGVEA